MMTEDLTKDDIRNGWTAESLAAYHAERLKAQSGVVLMHPDYRRKPRPTRANGKYNVMRPWG